MPLNFQQLAAQGGGQSLLGVNLFAQGEVLAIQAVHGDDIFMLHQSMSFWEPREIIFEAANQQVLRFWGVSH